MNSLKTFCTNRDNYPEPIYKILLCECYQNARKNLCAGNGMIFRIVEYFFILQYFQKISGAGSVSEERYFGTQNIFLFYDI